MRNSLTFPNRHTLLALGIATAVIVPGAASHAAPIAFVANLLPTNEVPPTASTGRSSAIRIPPVTRLPRDPALVVPEAACEGAATVSTTTASAAVAKATAARERYAMAVATTTPTFAGFPLGVTSGTYNNTLNMLAASSYNPAFIAGPFDPSHTVVGAETALFNGIENLETYLNIHTQQFGGGEIRGILVAPSLTPLVPAGAPTNAVAVSSAIDAVFASGAAPAEFVALLFNTPAASLPAALLQIGSQNESAAAQAGHESVRQFLSLVLDPFAAARDQAPLGSGTVWGAVYGSSLRIDGTPATGSPSESNQGGGLALGFDYANAPGIVFGGAISVEHRDFKIPQSFGSGRDNNYHFALYNKTELEAFYLTAAVDYSVYDIRSSRSLSFTGASGSYQAGYTGHGFAGRAEAGINSLLYGLTPFVAVLADTISMPAYSERVQSGSATFAIQSPSHAFDRVRSELGLAGDMRFRGYEEGNETTTMRAGVDDHGRVFGKTRAGSSQVQRGSHGTVAVCQRGSSP